VVLVVGVISAGIIVRFYNPSKTHTPTHFGMPKSKTYSRMLVNTTSGPVLSGVPFILTEHSEVAPFLGIPYAKPPVGSLRWRPPEPPETWEGNGVRSADTFGPICVQLRGRSNVLGAKVSTKAGHVVIIIIPRS